MQLAINTPDNIILKLISPFTKKNNHQQKINYPIYHSQQNLNLISYLLNGTVPYKSIGLPGVTTKDKSISKSESP